MSELEELWKKIEAKRKLWREQHPEEANRVICPFTDDMVCTGGCTSMKDRSCVNGE